MNTETKSKELTKKEKQFLDLISTELVAMDSEEAKIDLSIENIAEAKNRIQKRMWEMLCDGEKKSKVSDGLGALVWKDIQVENINSKTRDYINFEVA